jgi:hypothetical protein
MGGRGGGGAACTNDPVPAGDQWSGARLLRRVRAPAMERAAAHCTPGEPTTARRPTRSVEWRTGGGHARVQRSVCETMHCLSTGQRTPHSQPRNRAVCRLGLAGSFASKATGTCGDCAALGGTRRLLPDPAILCRTRARTRTDDETEAFRLGGQD